jgi:hypothetical protein
MASKAATTGTSDTARTKDRAKAATPWGPASVVEEVTLRQRTGDKAFATIVQLLETAKGEQLVRFAYSTGGTARRGPVTLRGRDLESLRTALARSPRLREVLRLEA